MKLIEYVNYYCNSKKFHKNTDGKSDSNSYGLCKVVLASLEENNLHRKLGSVIAECTAAHYIMTANNGVDGDDSISNNTVSNKVLLKEFTYSFRQRDRIGIVGSNG